MKYPLLITCPKYLEYLLQDELASFGLTEIKIVTSGILLEATLEEIYHIALWSRVANRLYLILKSGPVDSTKSLYHVASEINWQTLITPDKTFSIHFQGMTDFIRHTVFGAQVIKDAIVDQFNQTGERPSVDKVNPDIKIAAFLKKDTLTLTLDLVGYSLHQRGYRKEAALAPLKENLAGALLIRAKWPKLAAQGASLIDPFCGSGTILIEAALMATHTAPGLLREDQRFLNWSKHDETLWQRARIDAKKSIQPLRSALYGFDADAKAIAIAKHNALQAGFADSIHFDVKPIASFDTTLAAPGLLITNPPYGERLSDVQSLIPVYQALGSALAHHCSGWQAAVLCQHTLLAKAIGLRAHKQYAFQNGPLKTNLYCFNLNPDNILDEKSADQADLNITMLVNRLKKRKKHLDKWRKRTGVSCYRLYDADLPEYAVAIDLYEDWAHVQEYKPPASIPPHKAEKRLLDILSILPSVLSIPPKHIQLKQRAKQKGKSQYQPIGHQHKTQIVREGAAQFVVNLQDYLDTGLFLDHRLLRKYFHDHAKGKRFLNLFCYTATASVQAALGGAITTNVDLSKTYLSIAKDNFKLNHLDSAQHTFIHADCLAWLAQCKAKFDIIFLDPPTFSNSKRMSETLDIQRDHEKLIDLSMPCLTPDGELYFSTNLRTFKLASTLAEKYRIENITQQTIDEDFRNSQKVPHQCYRIQRRG